MFFSVNYENRTQKIKESTKDSIFICHTGMSMSEQKPSHKKHTSNSTTITMNEDLKEFIPTEEQEDISKTLDAKLKDKKPKGKCSICRVHPAKSVCIKCGNSVCSSCYFTMVGLCQNCLSKETIEKWKNKKTDWKKILDVDWVH
jgi:hypothetical protein